MPPLKNIRHEKFAQAMLETNTTKAAYKAAYPLIETDKTAIVNGSKLLTSSDIRSRIMELMQQNESLCPDGVTKRLGELVQSENEGIAIQSVNTALKAYGVFSEDKTDNSITAIQIVFSEPQGASSSQAPQPDSTNTSDTANGSSSTI